MIKFNDFDLDKLMQAAMESEVREAISHLFQTVSIHVLIVSRPVPGGQQGLFLEVTAYPDASMPAIEYLQNLLQLVKMLHDIGFSSVAEGPSVISELRISSDYRMTDLEPVRTAIERYAQEAFLPF